MNIWNVSRMLNGYSDDPEIDEINEEYEKTKREIEKVAEEINPSRARKEQSSQSSDETETYIGRVLGSIMSEVYNITNDDETKKIKDEYKRTKSEIEGIAAEVSSKMKGAD